MTPFLSSTQSSEMSAGDVFASFREFQGVIKGLSKKELMRRNWLESPEDDASFAYAFFKLPFPEQPTLFRKSENADENLLSIWEARVRTEAEHSYMSDLPSEFKGLRREDVREIASLSVEPEVVRELPAVLRKFGIILIYVYALPGMKADGVAFHLPTGTPVIALSLRFPRLDYFWFTLLHELAHIVLHNDHLVAPVYFDVEAVEGTAKIERSANRLAKESIVSRKSWRNCAPRYDSSDEAVRSYAAEQGVHPSLVAGLLRKESGNFTRYCSIINKHDVRKMIYVHD